MRLVIRALAIVVIAASSCTVTPVPTMSVSLERTGCFGFCPIYRVVVDSSGMASFDGAGYPITGRGRDSVGNLIVRRDSARIGRDRFDVISERFATLWQTIGAKHYTPDRPSCPDASTDSPSIMIIRTRPVGEDTLALYYGCRGYPARLDSLATLIDSIVGIERWIGPPPGR